MINIPNIVTEPLNQNNVASPELMRVQGARNAGNIQTLNLGRNMGVPVQQAAPPVPPVITPPVQTAAASVLQDKPVPVLHEMARKGQKVPLETEGKLISIDVCLGFNVYRKECDVDVSAFLLGENGKVPGDDWFVFYGQDTSPDGSTRFSHSGGEDREIISVDFTRLNPQVSRIVFVLTIHEALQRRLNFSMLKDCYIRILDDRGKELVSFLMEEYYATVTSMMIGEVYRHNGTWKFNAIGNGVARDLAGLCELYGVQVE